MYNEKQYAGGDAVIGGGLGGMYGIGAALVLIVILWVLFRDGFGHKGHGGYEGGHGHGCKCGCLSNCDVDRDVNKQGYTNKLFTEADGERTRNLIRHETERANDREFNKMTATIAEQRGEINNMKLFGMLKSELDEIKCTVNHLPKAAPCFLPTARAALQGCEPLPCGPFRREGGCGDR